MPVPESSPWLADAVLYQIYPQSFADGNGDGIGDLAGLAEHLDYLAWLGVDAVWLNPCFTSPFGDAGYDVADYFRIADRYGTNEDLVRLVEAARSRGIRVLLDLVPGHTSIEHPWFRASAADPDDHRYVWSDHAAGPGWNPSPGPRPGFYLQNFFPIQPALNFGYARLDEAEPWRQPIDAPGPLANRAALRDIMAYWLDRGVGGFRVDMAASLVKDDPGWVETGRLWRELRNWLDRRYPDAALLAEWGEPAVSVPAGFHADFFLHFSGRAFPSLWDTRTATLQEHLPEAPCFFDPEGRGAPDEFVEAYEAATATIAGAGFISLPTSNHDFARLACGPRTRDQLGPAFAFVLTWPTVPAIYYGDEIGMRYVPGLPDKEGSQLRPNYNRAGSRTPMQWDDTPGAGFSTAAPDRFYLPVDPAPDRPSVAAERADPGSLLHLVRRLIALRRAHPALGTGGDVRVLHSGYPLAYLRGERHLVVVNPRREPARITVDGLRPARALEARGVTVTGDELVADGFAHGIFELG
ncbi:alpha-amylase family glycosyl hydrolase [Rugosimonospora acidiphila]|uniref:Alpha-amylase family glycosyl hydrolase n=1 Tax=Rugosimonospora acidiphila TaxID=556531 RepID=A0ABP9S0E8_9ACTN